MQQALLDELTRLEREDERRRIDFSKDYLTYVFQAPTPEGTALVNDAWDAAKVHAPPHDTRHTPRARVQE